jgi:hypothetical protein
VCVQVPCVYLRYTASAVTVQNNNTLDVLMTHSVKLHLPKFDSGNFPAEQANSCYTKKLSYLGLFSVIPCLGIKINRALPPRVIKFNRLSHSHPPTLPELELTGYPLCGINTIGVPTTRCRNQRGLPPPPQKKINEEKKRVVDSAELKLTVQYCTYCT